MKTASPVEGTVGASGLYGCEIPIPARMNQRDARLASVARRECRVARLAAFEDERTNRSGPVPGGNAPPYILRHGLESAGIP